MDELTDKSLTGFERQLIENNAFELLEGNPGFREAVLEIERTLIDEWANTPIMAHETREKLWMKVNLLEEILQEVGDYYMNAQARRPQ